MNMNMSGKVNNGGEGEIFVESNNNNIIFSKRNNNQERENNENQSIIPLIGALTKSKFCNKQVGDVVKADDDDVDVEENKPKLPDGFYELEAIRNKKICNGKPLYYIKWRGWPEDSNTWEPLENLEACGKFIEAFEKRLRSRKSFRKYKRKPNGSHSKSKIKPPRLTAIFQNSLLDALGPASSAPPANFDEPIDHSGPTQPTSHSSPMHPISIRSENKEDGNNTNGSQQNDDNQEEIESDPRVNELRRTISADDVNHLEIGNDQRVSELRQIMYVGELNCMGNGIVKVDHATSGSSTLTGAKRRKTANPERWPQVSSPHAPVNKSCVMADSSRANGQTGAETPNSVRNSRSPKNNSEASRNVNALVKINKPKSIMTTMQNGTQSVCLQFSVERTDGTEVIVSNRFLKDHFPNLLFQYYEGHLKYNT